MKNINWNIVFALNELSEYLCNNELIELSMSSKKSRYLLTKEVFKALNFKLIAISKGYSSAFIKEDNMLYCKPCHFINPYKSLTSELINCTKQLRNDLEIFGNNTKNLVLSDSMGYFYLLYEIPSIFPNITTLVLNDSAFTMEALQNLLGSLKYLENLDLTENLIFKDAEISNDYTIDYPISLRSLKLGENGVMMIQDKFNSISKMKILHDTSGTTEFNGTYQHLPNLVTFDYDLHYDIDRSEDLYYDELDENVDLFQFVKLNPQLKNLILFGQRFNLKLFDIIKELECLTYLDFKCEYDYSQLDNYEIPILYNIKHLNIEADIYNDKMTKDNFPNVEELVIEFHWYNRDKLYRLIQRFPKLKFLKLISLRRYGDVENLTLPKLKNLEKLEVNFNYQEGKFDDIELDVNACDKLKLISITKNEHYSPFQKLDYTQAFNNNWNYYYFPHKLSFHKNF